MESAPLSWDSFIPCWEFALCGWYYAYFPFCWSYAAHAWCIRGESACLDFVFNSRKYGVLRIGSRFELSCAPLSLCGAPLAYADKVKYLGVIIVAWRYFKCSFEHVKSEFYCVLNTLLHRAHGASELVSVQLLKSLRVSVISYALEAVPPKKSFT